MTPADKITKNSKIVVPAGILGAGILAAFGWMLTMQRSIDQTLLELKFNRERIETHSVADKIKTPADVRDAMR